MRNVLVRLLDGHVLGGSEDEGAIHACQAHIVSDLTLACDDVPSIDTWGRSSPS